MFNKKHVQKLLLKHLEFINNYIVNIINTNSEIGLSECPRMKDLKNLMDVELSNDAEMDNPDNEDCDDEFDEEDYESNSVNGLLNGYLNATLDDDALLNKSTKRKLSDSSNKCVKKRKCRTTFSKSQLNALEKEFLNSNFVSIERIDFLIELTGLDSRIIKVMCKL